MRVAFDLDGVVYNMVPELDKYFASKGVNVRDPTKYELYERFGISKREGDKLLREFGDTRPFLTMPLIQDAKDEMITRAGYCDLYIVTFRDWTPNGIEDTLERIKRDGLPIKKENIIFSKHKGDVAKQLGINIFYEDNLNNARDIRKKSDAMVVLIDTLYNKGDGERIQRIKW